jgi:hypothetical protein
MRLRYGGALFARVYSRCYQPALFAGVLEALVAFGGVPRNDVFDNASTGVKKVLIGRSRHQNMTFRAFSGSLHARLHSLPGQGKRKGWSRGRDSLPSGQFLRAFA